MEYQKASSRHKVLSLMDMSSAFFVLGLGVSRSILVFLIELIYKRINDHYFQEKNTHHPALLLPPTVVQESDDKKVAKPEIELISSASHPSEPAKEQLDNKSNIPIQQQITVMAIVTSNRKVTTDFDNIIVSNNDD